MKNNNDIKIKGVDIMPAGRPKFKIDYDTVLKLASIMCTQEEIASHLGCSRDTLLRDEQFCDIYKKGLDNGKMSLRRVQYKTALGGNATMQIFLGKNLLGQRDRFPEEVENNDINKQIQDIAKLINNPKPTRTENDINE